MIAVHRWSISCAVSAVAFTLSAAVGDRVLGSAYLSGCPVDGFGEKLLEGATYCEDAFVRDARLGGVVTTLPDGRQVTVVWAKEKGIEPNRQPRYEAPFYTTSYGADGQALTTFNGRIGDTPVYFVRSIEAQFREVSRRAIRYSDKPMNFVFAHRWTNGEIWMSHSIGRHKRDEHHVTLLSKDNGNTWTFDSETGSGFMCFERRDGTRCQLGSWHMDGHAPTNEHTLSVTTYSPDGRSTTKRVKLVLPWPGMCGLHRDVQRLSDGRLIAEGWGKFEETGGVEAGGKCANYFLESVDDGVTWRYLSVYPYEKGLREGLFESTLVERKDGSLLAICRTGYSIDGKTRNPLLQFISRDGGKTWGERREISDNGVAPQATLLADGTLVVLTGRPNLFMLIDRTGLGEHYEKYMITKARTSAYASLVELAPGRIAVFFDESAFIHEPGDTPWNRIMQAEYEYTPNPKRM